MPDLKCTHDIEDSCDSSTATHIFFQSDHMAEMAKDKGAIKRWLTIPVLYDLEARLKMMEGFPD